jgi:hypothetical protein
MAKIDHKTRLQVEKMIYDTFSAVDTTGANTEYWKAKLSPMSDDEFYKFMKRRLPFRYHLTTFKNEPKMGDIIRGFKVIDKPLLEKVNLPYLHKNKDGVPVQTKECMVIYLNVPRMKQMLLKKTNNAIDATHRDMTGMLMNQDKGGKMSDREFQSLASTDLNNTIYEFSGPRADAMKAKQQMNNIISQKGFVSLEDIPKDKEDSLAKNMMNAWLIGSNIMTNLVCTDYETPRTIERRRNRGVERV